MERDAAGGAAGQRRSQLGQSPGVSTTPHPPSTSPGDTDSQKEPRSGRTPSTSGCILPGSSRSQAGRSAAKPRARHRASSRRVPSCGSVTCRRCGAVSRAAAFAGRLPPPRSVTLMPGCVSGRPRFLLGALRLRVRGESACVSDSRSVAAPLLPWITSTLRAAFTDRRSRAAFTGCRRNTTRTAT